MHCFSVTIKIYYKQVSGQRSTWKTTKYTAGCERDSGLNQVQMALISEATL